MRIIMLVGLGLALAVAFGWQLGLTSANQKNVVCRVVCDRTPILDAIGISGSRYNIQDDNIGGTTWEP